MDPQSWGHRSLRIQFQIFHNLLSGVFFTRSFDPIVVPSNRLGAQMPQNRRFFCVRLHRLSIPDIDTYFASYRRLDWARRDVRRIFVHRNGFPQELPEHVFVPQVGSGLVPRGFNLSVWW